LSKYSILSEPSGKFVAIMNFVFSFIMFKLCYRK
jgi:hypothetical protein